MAKVNDEHFLDVFILLKFLKKVPIDWRGDQHQVIDEMPVASVDMSGVSRHQ
ncbi:hypothetical protein GWL_08400 [Herbaspirillum sp. GW103]|nr:hypothetical protein GWL_08400 [Herbaspirillum sp. GW103]